MGKLAELLGISVPYLSDVELGRRAPFDADRIKAAAVALEIDPSELEKAAAVSRGAFAIAAGPTPLHVDVGAELARTWTGLGAEELDAVRAALRAERADRYAGRYFSNPDRNDASLFRALRGATGAVLTTVRPSGALGLTCPDELEEELVAGRIVARPDVAPPDAGN